MKLRNLNHVWVNVERILWALHPLWPIRTGAENLGRMEGIHGLSIRTNNEVSAEEIDLVTSSDDIRK